MSSSTNRTTVTFTSIPSQLKMQHGTYLFTAAILLAFALTLSYGAAWESMAPGPDKDIEEGSTPEISACHLADFVIDFNGLNLNFIKRPKTINIGQCIGYCPEIRGFSSTYYNLMRMLSGHNNMSLAAFQLSIRMSQSCSPSSNRSSTDTRHILNYWMT